MNEKGGAKSVRLFFRDKNISYNAKGDDEAMLRLIGNIIVFCLLITTAKDVRILAKAWIRQLVVWFSPKAFAQRRIRRKVDRLAEAVESEPDSKGKEN